MPPMYHYSFTLLQRSYPLNIPRRTRAFPITVWVRYSSERPTTPGGRLHPGRRRPRGLLTIPNHDAGVAGLRLSSRSDPKNIEDGPPLHLLLASASVFLVSCLRLSTRRQAKTGHLRTCSWHRLQRSWCLVFAHLRRPDRRWCPQQSPGRLITG